MESNIENILSSCISKIEEIHFAIINRRNSKGENSILGGKAGELLFLYQYCRFANTDPIKILSDGIDLILEDDTIGLTFARGQSGINWFFTYLKEKGLIDDDDFAIIYDNSMQLKQNAIYYLANGNCDFLHGALGIGYSMLYNKESVDKFFFSSFFDQLESNLSNEYNMFIDFDLLTNKPNNNTVNFGLAHGIPSILKFCIECYRQDLYASRAKSIGNRIIDFLLDNQNKKRELSFYPCNIGVNSKEDTNSRLAWCYGDLGVAFILYQSGLVFNNQFVISHGLEILIHSTQRLSLPDTTVYDAGICHGSAGVAHIYNIMWKYTDNPIFKKATEYWINKTLDFAYFDDGLAGYKKYNMAKDDWTINYGLLEGITGIGLVLLSYLTEDFGWNYCLMLND